MSRFAAALYGLFVFVVAIASGLVIGTLGVLPFVLIPRGRRERFTIHAAVAWSRLVTTLLARRLQVTGAPGLRSGEGALVICNHRSWLDPLLLMTWTRSNGLSKSQILYIPVIGLYGWLAGTVFFDRKSRDGRTRARREVLHLALCGSRIQVFPEGTRTAAVRPRERVYLRLMVDCYSRGIAVVPCAVVGSDDVLPPGRFGVWPFQPVFLDVGTALRPADHPSATAFATACWEDVRRRHAALLDRATTSP